MQQRKILVTTALIYANGDLHLGHLVENIRCDIWVKFQRLQHHDVLHIGGSDCHGTPIMINAEKQGLSPEQLVTESRARQQRDFKDFGIDFDNFYLTHSPENKALCVHIYKALEKKGDIEKRVIAQAFDPIKQMFLPDRFIKGTCPRCGAHDQYGDGCEQCGATYAPTELKNPKSILSEATPETRESEHYFFKLENYTQALKTWINAGHLQTQVANKLKEWFTAGLLSWDISRDEPYFGFEIPDAPGKYFYVWLDAPIGYLASLANLAARRPDIRVEDYWHKDSTAEVYHFLGKDIIYFHALFWPAMLMSADYRTPTALFVNGFLTINGEKLSKSRGNFILARTYLDHLDPEYLRYYLATRLTPHLDDIDLNFEEFAARVNADLVGKYVNLASRTASFITQKFNGKLSDTLHDPQLYADMQAVASSIKESYEVLDYARVTRTIMELADRANQYVAQHAPWQLIKEDSTKAVAHAVCTQALNCFCLLSLYLKPILPNTVARVEDFLKIPALDFAHELAPLLNHTINPFTPLLQRIDQSTLDKLVSPV